jgi:hypothetical protein
LSGEAKYPVGARPSKCIISIIVKHLANQRITLDQICPYLQTKAEEDLEPAVHCGAIVKGRRQQLPLRDTQQYYLAPLGPVTEIKRVSSSAGGITLPLSIHMPEA